MRIVLSLLRSPFSLRVFVDVRRAGVVVFVAVVPAGAATLLRVLCSRSMRPIPTLLRVAQRGRAVYWRAQGRSTKGVTLLGCWRPSVGA